MTAVTGFGALSLPSATALILGSMPGVRSLEAQQYYAHPRNHFWRIMACIVGFDASASYETRIAAVTRSGIALWDVLHRCVRAGSLDSSIEAGTRIPNDFATFLKEHPAIKLICFNGAEAEKSYKRYVLPNQHIQGLHYTRLPSTSPARALPFEQKLAAWQAELSSIGRAG